MKLPGETDYGHAVTRTCIQTYKTIDNNGLVWDGRGSIQYGVYRNGANLAAGDTETLIVYHDDVTITKLASVPEPSAYGLLGGGALATAAVVRRRRRRAVPAA